MLEPVWVRSAAKLRPRLPPNERLAASGLSKAESSSESGSYSESIAVGHSKAIGKGFSSGVTKTYWTKVGAAWPHKDGKGLTVSISPGISVSGRIVLREWTEEQPQSHDDKI